MGVPTVEKAPGLREPWLGYWRASLREMKETGAWSPALRPLLDEYVLALRGARVFREAADRQSFVESDSGRTFIHPGYVASDREARRALMLADSLGLLPQHGRVAATPVVDDPFAELDALAPRRALRGLPDGSGLGAA